MERLSKTLIANGIKAASIHGAKSQPARDRALSDFKLGHIKVLVATDGELNMQDSCTCMPVYRPLSS